MNQIDLENRVAVITGGTRGIGYAVAERMLRSGAAVAVWDTDSAQLFRAEMSLGQLGRVATVSADVTSESQVNKAVRQTLETFGRLDILINSAGMLESTDPTSEVTPSIWREVIEVNLFAPFLTCRAAIPAMLKSGYGRIVNVSSTAGKEGDPGASHYSASKGGLIALTKSLGYELATKNILVNCVAPATAHTDSAHHLTPDHIQQVLSRIPMGRLGEPHEIAGMICWLASDECSFTTGAVFDVSGGSG